MLVVENKNTNDLSFALTKKEFIFYNGRTSGLIFYLFQFVPTEPWMNSKHILKLVRRKLNLIDVPMSAITKKYWKFKKFPKLT